eukprot:1195870-Prorocentrum_minimum.AAC.7
MENTEVKQQTKTALYSSFWGPHPLVPCSSSHVAVTEEGPSAASSCVSMHVRRCMGTMCTERAVRFWPRTRHGLRGTCCGLRDAHASPYHESLPLRFDRFFSHLVQAEG